MSRICLYNLSHVARKPVFRVSDQVRLKKACSATESNEAQADLHLCCSHMAKIGFLMTWIILYMTKTFRMATKRSQYLYLCVYYKNWLFNKSVYCFYNVFLHLLVSKSFITPLISLFKYKLLRKIIVFNLYLPSGSVHSYPLDEYISNFRGV